ncbi:binding partner of ACD11 1-like isoform X3 [Mangifera indica]|uniref:binding partner of ACD11 1-like isoform X3 n=1 Tax=Mangifera indica TaxID=29780 RepID=UPI001CF941A7|nr:binding partner of ACD11 1-like isoform X3 [Mangifera indica]
MTIRTVKVSNVSLSASQQDIKEFFSFSGEIEHIELHSSNERSQIAYVVFKDPQGAETAILLSGAQNKNAGGAESAVQKAEDVVSSMLAKGFVLGKDAVNKAKAFDEKHRFTSTATATVVSIDKKIGLSEKISAGTSLVNDKVREMDQKFQVSGKTKSALSAAEQTVSNAGSAIMKNRYILTGASWVTGAFNRVSKVAGEVSQKTQEKVLAEEEEARKAEGYVQVHESESPKAAK